MVIRIMNSNSINKHLFFPLLIRDKWRKHNLGDGDKTTPGDWCPWSDPDPEISENGKSFEINA